MVHWWSLGDGVKWTIILASLKSVEKNKLYVILKYRNTKIKLVAVCRRVFMKKKIAYAVILVVVVSAGAIFGVHSVGESQEELADVNTVADVNTEEVIELSHCTEEELTDRYVKYLENSYVERLSQEEDVASVSVSLKNKEDSREIESVVVNVETVEGTSESRKEEIKDFFCKYIETENENAEIMVYLLS
jgi:hypothetical protein